jgi:hypothetical protein
MKDRLEAWEFFVEQLSTTTGEQEEQYFSGSHEPTPLAPREGVSLPSGDYRIVAGDLYRILPGVPESLASRMQVAQGG